MGPPAPEQPPQEKPRYGLEAMLEDTLLAAFKPRSLFDRLAQEPVAPWAVMVANWVAYNLLVWTVLFIFVGIRHPNFVKFANTGPVGTFLFLTALIAITLAGFFCATVLHLCALAVGGSGGFGRSYQIVSTLSLLGLLNLLAREVPGAWLVILVLWAYIFIVAFERLHRCPPWRTRLAIGAFAVILAGVGLLTQLWYSRLLQSDPDMAELFQSAQQVRQSRQDKP